MLARASLVYRMAQPQDKDRIFQFLMTHFVKDEPCSRALKLSTETAESIFSTTVDRCLAFPFSTLVIDEHTGKLAGCIVGSVWNRSDSVEDADFASQDLAENIQLFGCSLPVSDVVKFLNEAHSNFWKVAPSHIDSVIHGEMGSVAKPYIRAGVARRMLSECLRKEHFQRYNIGGVISETSSLRQQFVLEKFGFKCLKEMPYSQIVDAHGRPVLQLDDGTTVLKLHFKEV